MIVSELVKIEIHSAPTTEFIETAFSKMGISPLRWAVVKVESDTLTVSVAHDKI